MKEQNSKVKPLYSLIPLGDFKAILGIDDRDDKISQFCLVTATHSIEQYCKRRLLRKMKFEYIEYFRDFTLILGEYPVTDILALYALFPLRQPELIEPELYEVVPEYGTDIDTPFAVYLSPALKRYRYIAAFKAVYMAGYRAGNVQPDLASACLELAAWNMGRYRGRRIGMTGEVRGKGRDGEHYELSMPENVKALLEPYRRKVL